MVLSDQQRADFANFENPLVIYRSHKVFYQQ